MERNRSRAKSKLWRGALGYTIIETMIFLIVSSAFVGTIVTALTQQNKRQQFVQAVDKMQVNLQDTLNDVSTGYYPFGNTLQCTASATGPSVSNGSNEQGTNSQCIFIGKAIQFAPNSDGIDSYSSYTMVGNRIEQVAGGEEVTSLTQAKPKFLGIGGQAGVYDTFQLESGVEIQKVVSQNPDNTFSTIGGIEVISDFSKRESNVVSGNASRSSLARVGTSDLLMTRDNFATLALNPTYVESGVNVEKGIIICLREGNNGRKASITIGGSKQQMSLERTIDSWPGACD
jgi:hypothetical protein